MIRIFKTLALILVVLTGVLGATSAFFADWETTQGNTLAAGKVDLEVKSSQSPLFSFTNIAPGEEKREEVIVANIGSLHLFYSLRTSIENNEDGFCQELKLLLKDSNGVVLYNGPLSQTSFGSSNQGLDEGDRELATDESEFLTFAATLPSTTGEEFQKKNCQVNFIFEAEQR